LSNLQIGRKAARTLGFAKSIHMNREPRWHSGPRPMRVATAMTRLPAAWPMVWLRARLALTRPRGVLPAARRLPLGRMLEIAGGLMLWWSRAGARHLMLRRRGPTTRRRARRSRRWTVFTGGDRRAMYRRAVNFPP